MTHKMYLDTPWENAEVIDSHSRPWMVDSQHWCALLLTSNLAQYGLFADVMVIRNADIVRMAEN